MTKIPLADQLPRSCFRVLLVVLQAAQRGETLTNREITRRCGWRMPGNGNGNGTVDWALHRLRDEGLVTWEQTTNGFMSHYTLRPTCRLELVGRHS